MPPMVLMGDARRGATACCLQPEANWRPGRCLGVSASKPPLRLGFLLVAGRDTGFQNFTAREGKGSSDWRA
jgi:hypothetical protein